MEFCQELYDTIRNHKTEDGRLLCESFIRVPKRRFVSFLIDRIVLAMFWEYRTGCGYINVAENMIEDNIADIF